MSELSTKGFKVAIVKKSFNNQPHIFLQQSKYRNLNKEMEVITEEPNGNYRIGGGTSPDGLNGRWEMAEPNQ